ncbi:MAG: TonB-dependent receptor [bacterium]
MRVFIAVCLLPAAMFAQTRPSVIHGRVTDAATNERVTGALVTVVGDTVQARSDDNGRFTITVHRAGANIINVRRLGYSTLSRTVDIAAGDTAEVELRLQPASAPLDTVSVKAAETPLIGLDAFERRRAQKKGGFYVTRADIDHLVPSQTSDLLRRASGVEVVQKALKTAVVSKRGMVIRMGQPQPVLCIIPIGMDGLVLGPDYDINDIPVNDIHGIEVYSGPATVPVEYRNSLPNGFCGLVMIWTRHGAAEARRP